LSDDKHDLERCI